MSAATCGSMLDDGRNDANLVRNTEPSRSANNAIPMVSSAQPTARPQFT